MNDDKKLREKLEALGLSTNDVDEFISKMGTPPTDERNQEYAELFNDCKLVIAKLTNKELDELIKSIQQEAFEAKARLLACQEEKQEREKGRK